MTHLTGPTHLRPEHRHQRLRQAAGVDPGGGKLPCRAAAQAMAQVEDPVSLALRDNPAYRLVTLIRVQPCRSRRIM